MLRMVAMWYIWLMRNAESIPKMPELACVTKIKDLAHGQNHPEVGMGEALQKGRKNPADIGALEIPL